MTRKPENATIESDPIQAMTVSPFQNHFALACRNEIKILQISVDSLSEQSILKLELKSRDNFTLTDVSWSPRNHKFLAASANNGAVVVFNINDKKQIWSSIESTSSVNKINWSPLHDDILASCFQDGSIKLFDIRDKKKCSQTTFSTRSESCRDVRFNNFNQNIFAGIYENGNLIVWDRRKIDNPQTYLTKLSAHTTSGLSLAWNPYNENTVATGSRDKSVKVWDLNSVSLNEPRPIHVVHTLSAVNYLAWRPGSQQWATQIATASSSESQIFIWNLALPNVPACILRGLKDPCSGLAWLDTPATTTMTEHSNSNTSRGAWQHILSTGKNGQLILQDLRKGHFPRQHMAASTVSLSVCGDIAMHFGTIIRSDILGFTLPPPPPSTASSGTALSLFESSSSSQFQKMMSVTPTFSQMKLFMTGSGSGGVADGGDSAAAAAAAAVELQGGGGGGGSTSIGDELLLYDNSGIFTDPSSLFSTLPAVGNSSNPNPGPGHESEGLPKPSSFHSEPLALLDSTSATATTTVNTTREREKGGVTQSQLPSSALSHSLSLSLATPDKLKSSQGRSGHLLFREGSTVSEARRRRKRRNSSHIGLPPRTNREATIDQDSEAEGVGEEGGEELDLVDGPLDPCTIRRLALGYTASGAWREVCETNAAVAQDVGMLGHSLLWESLLVVLPGIVEGEGEGEGEAGGGESEELQASLTSLTFLPLLQDLLLQLLDHGDCQHFVIVCELLKKEKIPPSVLTSLTRLIPESRRKEAYYSYWELLHRLQLPVLAGQLCMRSDISQLAERSRHNVDMKHCCSRCGRSTPEALKHGQEWCKNCKVNNSLCVLCHKPVGGLLLWCPVCGHGGHKACIQKWFGPPPSPSPPPLPPTAATRKTLRTCPAACGHECVIPSVHANPTTIRPGKNQRGIFLSTKSFCELTVSQPRKNF